MMGDELTSDSSPLFCYHSLAHHLMNLRISLEFNER